MFSCPHWSHSGYGAVECFAYRVTPPFLFSLYSMLLGQLIQCPMGGAPLDFSPSSKYEIISGRRGHPRHL